jgi:hypothetical protein
MSKKLQSVTWQACRFLYEDREVVRARACIGMALPTLFRRFD